MMVFMKRDYFVFVNAIVIDFVLSSVYTVPEKGQAVEGQEACEDDMNYQGWDILQAICCSSEERSQRELAKESCCSLGIVNRTLQFFRAEGLVDGHNRPTGKALQMAAGNRTERAVILAAGFGMRMVPINAEMPKGMLTVYGEVLIERLIRQLQQAGVHEIWVVTGYMKEQYEYLADAFGVNLLICRDYMTKNNLYSLFVAREHLENAYIVPCDLYFYRNPFHPCEFYSWYLLSRDQIEGADVRANRNREIFYLNGDADTVGNRIAGLAYIRKEIVPSLRNRLTVVTASRSNGRAYWELAVTKKNKMTLPAKFIDPEDFVEIDTYEQLRELDWYNEQLRNEIIGSIEQALGVAYEDIRNIRYLKKGLTNLSFLFEVGYRQYIMRIPSWGAEYIDRRKEGLVYDLIRGLGLCDDNVYFNPENGFKIARYLPDAHICNPGNEEEVRQCLQLARKLHSQNLQIKDRLDVFNAIQWYEDLRKGTPSQYRDYARIKAQCMAMRSYVEAHAHPACLIHGNCTPENFLFSTDENGETKLQLIDWEYAFNCDPLFDVAGFVVHRAYDPAFTELVIRSYWPEGCTPEDRMLLYAYCALFALQTSNWCERWMSLGIDLDEFALICYRNAKAFCTEFERRSKSS